MHPAHGREDHIRVVILERETLDEKEILAVTGLARASRLEDADHPVSQAAPDADQDRWNLR